MCDGLEIRTVPIVSTDAPPAVGRTNIYTPLVGQKGATERTTDSDLVQKIYPLCLLADVENTEQYLNTMSQESCLENTLGFRFTEPNADCLKTSPLFISCIVYRVYCPASI